MNCISRIKIWRIWKFAERETLRITSYWPHGRMAAEHSVVYVRSCVSTVGCDGVRVCGGELCSRCHVYEKPLGCECRRGNAVRVVRSSSDAKERHHRPCTQEEDIGCLLAISGRPAACSLFLADHRQRYSSIMSACATASLSFATRPRPHHVMTNFGGI